MPSKRLRATRAVPLVFALLVAPGLARAESRPPHLVVGAGAYAALGSPASWGPSLSLDVLPGNVAQRWGLRGEYRGYEGFDEGSILVGALYEAGASRPQLALKLVIEAGATHDLAPIVGGGIDWSLWLLGPLGVSIITDVQVIIDGSDTRPALSSALTVHLGR